jgi:hypothetical protein
MSIVNIISTPKVVYSFFSIVNLGLANAIAKVIISKDFKITGIYLNIEFLFWISFKIKK